MGTDTPYAFRTIASRNVGAGPWDKVFCLPNPFALPTTAFADLSESDARDAADALNALRKA